MTNRVSAALFSRFEGRLENGRIAGELIGAQSRQPLVLERAR